MRISAVTSTDLFTGTTQRPLQIIHVTLVNDDPGLVTDARVPVEVRVDGPGVSTPEPVRVTGLEPGGTLTAEVPVEFAAPTRPAASAGSPRPPRSRRRPGGRGGSGQRGQPGAARTRT